MGFAGSSVKFFEEFVGRRKRGSFDPLTYLWFRSDLGFYGNENEVVTQMAELANVIYSNCRDTGMPVFSIDELRV